ncbi:MAG: hypothetical protein R3339_08745 [Thermodesulfobacteriota bacterium]|nr:hypothetical protein [Thermodesulfobacteriota bacterium]
MKSYFKNVVSVICVMVFLGLAIAPQANALLIESIVGENGIEVEYEINRRLTGEITITPDDPWELNIRDLIVLQLAITDVVLDPPVGAPIVNLHFYFKLSYPSEVEFENDLFIPFGELGFETDRLNRDFMSIDESNQVDISVLSTVNRFQYAINLNFGEIYSDRWEGEATFLDPKITEEVIIDVAALIDFLPGGDLPDEIPEEMKWEIMFIPVFTVGSLNLALLQVDAFIDGILTSSIPADFPFLGEFLSLLPVPLAKGNSHFWYKSEAFQQ